MAQWSQTHSGPSVSKHLPKLAAKGVIPKMLSWCWTRRSSDRGAHGSRDAGTEWVRLLWYPKFPKKEVLKKDVHMGTGVARGKRLGCEDTMRPGWLWRWHHTQRGKGGEQKDDWPCQEELAGGFVSECSWWGEQAPEWQNYCKAWRAPTSFTGRYETERASPFVFQGS